MKAWDFDAVVYDGAVYCVECVPRKAKAEETAPIFACHELDAYPTCSKCGGLHDYMGLTRDGIEYERRQGRYSD